jgi:DNA-binding Lrp family transcriptional regulator
VFCLENVFADLTAQINVGAYKEERFKKPKREAFVFITTEPNTAKTAFEDLSQLEEIKELYLSHGVYDIVAKVTGESLEHLRELVAGRIKNSGNIKSTLTLMVI